MAWRLPGLAEREALTQRVTRGDEPVAATLGPEHEREVDVPRDQVVGLFWVFLTKLLSASNTWLNLPSVANRTR